MKLTKSERAWLDAYRRALVAVRPPAIERMLIYGSKARGDAGPDSDLDVLLIVKHGAARRKRTLRRIGYLLAATTDVAPSIMAYTADEWQRLEETASPFQRAVERDKVVVL